MLVVINMEIITMIISTKLFAEILKYREGVDFVVKMLLNEVCINEEYRTAVIITDKAEISGSNPAERLKEYYHLLNCKRIDFRKVKINGKYFDLIFDKDGELAEEPIPTFYIKEDNSILFGNILISQSDENGKTIGLEDNELFMLAKYVSENLKELQSFLASVYEKQNSQKKERV